MAPCLGRGARVSRSIYFLHTSQDSPTSPHIHSPRVTPGNSSSRPRKGRRMRAAGPAIWWRACPDLPLPAGGALGVGAQQRPALCSAVPGSRWGPCTAGPLWARRALLCEGRRPALLTAWATLGLGVHSREQTLLFAPGLASCWKSCSRSEARGESVHTNGWSHDPATTTVQNPLVQERNSTHKDS